MILHQVGYSKATLGGMLSQKGTKKTLNSMTSFFFYFTTDLQCCSMERILHDILNQLWSKEKKKL